MLNSLQNQGELIEAMLGVLARWRGEYVAFLPHSGHFKQGSRQRHVLNSNANDWPVALENDKTNLLQQTGRIFDSCSDH